MAKKKTMKPTELVMSMILEKEDTTQEDVNF